MNRELTKKSVSKGDGKKKTKKKSKRQLKRNKAPPPPPPRHHHHLLSLIGGEKNITQNRITRKLGLFATGRGSSTVLRYINEERKAREEQDLNKILKLSDPKTTTNEPHLNKETRDGLGPGLGGNDPHQQEEAKENEDDKGARPHPHSPSHWSSPVIASGQGKEKKKKKSTGSSTTSSWSDKTRSRMKTNHKDLDGQSSNFLSSSSSSCSTFSSSSSSSSESSSCCSSCSLQSGFSEFTQEKDFLEEVCEELNEELERTIRSLFPNELEDCFNETCRYLQKIHIQSSKSDNNWSNWDFRTDLFSVDCIRSNYSAKEQQERNYGVIPDYTESYVGPDLGTSCGDVAASAAPPADGGLSVFQFDEAHEQLDFEVQQQQQQRHLVSSSPSGLMEKYEFVRNCCETGPGKQQLHVELKPLPPLNPIPFLPRGSDIVTTTAAAKTIIKHIPHSECVYNEQVNNLRSGCCISEMNTCLKTLPGVVTCCKVSKRLIESSVASAANRQQMLLRLQDPNDKDILDYVDNVRFDTPLTGVGLTTASPDSEGNPTWQLPTVTSSSSSLLNLPKLPSPSPRFFRHKLY